MDSDASADEDFENQPSPNRSWTSNISEGQPSSPGTEPESERASRSGSEPKSPTGKEDSPERESSPESRHSDETEKNDSPNERNNGDSSPEQNVNESDRGSTPEVNDEIDSSQDAKEIRSGDSTPLNNVNEMKANEEEEEEEGEELEREEQNGEDTEPEKSPAIVNDNKSPENGAWSAVSPAGSIDEDDRPLKENKIESIENENGYENVNGTAPISPREMSPSFDSERSLMGSSLDSVSPPQSEPGESRKSFDDGAEEMQKEEDAAEDNKKGVIDFADDLSDVSDVESNDSFDKGREEESPEPRKEETPEKEPSHVEEPLESRPEESPAVAETNDFKQEDAVSLHVDTEEQLDFEAEEGECSPKPEKKKEIEEIKVEKEQSDLEEGELTDDNETKTEDVPICRFFSRGHCTWGTNCRFMHPGVMDKGNYSMFDTVRPIVTPGHPPPNPGGPIIYPTFPPHIGPPHLPGERGMMMPPGGPSRKEEPVAETSWERGLRQAKEMIRKSSKRKETEIDFEDKKMNLTLNQDEIDKENDYYSRRSNSPVKSPDHGDKWKGDADLKGHRSDPYPNELPPPLPLPGDGPPLGYYPPLHHGISRQEYWNPHRVGGLPPYEDYPLRTPHLPPYGPDLYAGRRYMHPNSYYPPRPGGGVGGPPAHHQDFYERKAKHKPYPGSSREVIVQKNEKPYKDDSPARYRLRREESPRPDRARDDEWADPWMRAKSPAGGRRRSRKNTYSSGSSYSSSSDSSRSSSRSSVSSRAHRSTSRTKRRSSGSSSRSASEMLAQKKPMQFKMSPSSRQQIPPLKKNPKAISPSMMERRLGGERTMHLNAAASNDKAKLKPHSPMNSSIVGKFGSSTASPARSKTGLPDRLLAHSKAAVAAAMRSTRSSESRSSKSSSGSSSSDSSDSSDSSSSSSSSGKSKTPPVRIPKRHVQEERIPVSQTVKTKAMDALKLSGQKQQIKLTLKGSTQSKRPGAADNSDRKDRPSASLAGKKRAAESSDSDSASARMSPAKKSMKQNVKKAVPSRRDELLKQLKAVEDAIARKRSRNL